MSNSRQADDEAPTRRMICVWCAAGALAGLIMSARAETTPTQQSTLKATAALPATGHWRYAIKGSTKGLPYQANGTLTWQHEKNRYEARMEISVFLLGTRTQTSTGTLTATGLAPRLFVDEARKRRETHFDPDTGQVLFASTGTRSPLPDGTQDRLSVLLQMSTRLQAMSGKTAPPANWSLPVAGSNSLDTWEMTLQGQERLDLPAGPWDTLKYARTPRHPGDQRVEAWFAPALRHMLVRLRLSEDNGDTVDQRLQSLPTNP